MKLLLVMAVIFLTAEVAKSTGPNGKIVGEVRKFTAETGRTEEADEKKDIFDINRNLQGLIDGDVLPRKSTRNTITDTAEFWPSTKIPFAFGPNLSLEAIGSIQLARQEYRLRTCLDFVERTKEQNYIIYQTLSGCYSSVGMVGGVQTISIGNGCERMATVCHEMMHAIGIWHEQSRADRDDYVEIMWDVIEAGYENNFRKYDWEVSDARRVPYDYNSIMHYSDTGFSTNGDPTIVTRDPAFQDLIGQRNTFSRGDSDKINRMYQCSDTLLVSYNCNFDDEAECGYVNDFDSDNIDWLRYDVGDKSVNVSPNVPSNDATWGVAGKGSYMVLDTSGKADGQLAELRSMRFVSRNTVQCLQFSYYIDIDASSTAGFGTFVATLDDVTGEVTEEGDALITLSESTNGNWHVQRMTIEGPSAYRVLFKGKTSTFSDDVLAIDDISVQDKPCEDAYFLKEDYNSILSTYEKGDYFYSPIMTTTQGYNFKLKIYPQGSTSSATGYMSMYFGLVKGPNDDDLVWPFCNKYIRMMVVDQNENPLYGLNKYSEYLTSQSAGGDLWNKPSSEDTAAGYYGYSNYMKISDLTETNNYLKNDALMISVLTQDMNWVNNDKCSGNFTRIATDPQPKAGRSAQETHPGVDYINPPDDGNIDPPIYDHDDDHHDNDHDDDHHHDDHHHDNDHGTDGDMVPIGAAVAVALGCAGFVFIVMSFVLMCVIKSHKKNLKGMTNNVVVHTNTPVPPAYPAEKVTFDPLPVPKV